jgi:quinolinate synthase
MVDIHNENFINNQIATFGFYNIEIDPTLNLFEEITNLKKEKNAIILAHYYQDAEIQEIADYLGDSLGLSQKAANTNADIILFAGVHFMAETAKILNPTKKVLIPDLKAGCSLSDSTPTTEFQNFINNYPNHIVISYINCSAEIKALSDIICTSSNAIKIVESLPKNQQIIFAPDKNLGNYINKVTGRNMILWNGSCMVHENFNLEKLIKLKIRHPKAQLISHPECEEEILAISDYIGSTTELLRYTEYNPSNEFIIATEAGILHQMQKLNPTKIFIPGPNNTICACNECPFMKLNTLEKVYITLKYEIPEINLDKELINKAILPIKRMLELS